MFFWKIDVNYNVERHGIIRNIPLKNNVFTLDGKTMVLRAKVKDINVNNEFEHYNENDNKIILELISRKKRSSN